MCSLGRGGRAKRVVLGRGVWGLGRGGKAWRVVLGGSRGTCDWGSEPSIADDAVKGERSVGRGAGSGGADTHVDGGVNHEPGVT